MRVSRPFALLTEVPDEVVPRAFTVVVSGVLSVERVSHGLCFHLVRISHESRELRSERAHHLHVVGRRVVVFLVRDYLKVLSFSHKFGIPRQGYVLSADLVYVRFAFISGCIAYILDSRVFGSHVLA